MKVAPREMVYDLVNLPEKKMEDRKSVIEIRKLKKEYPLAGGNEVVTALHEINICDESEFKAIKKGEFLMLRGPSGCGKTTLLNITGTIDHLSSGTIGTLLGL